MQAKYSNQFRQHLYHPLHHLGSVEMDPHRYAYCVCMFRDDDCPVNMATEAVFAMMREKYDAEPWAGACVEDEATVDMTIARGATLITCNNPDVVLKLLREKGYHK